MYNRYVKIRKSDKNERGVTRMSKKCIVAVSGGVDSAVALSLLSRDSAVEGITMVTFGRDLVPTANDSELDDARRLCESMSVTHHTVDLSEDFRRIVVGDFVSAYASGETPNPCVVCNKYLKFGLLADRAFALGADSYATGHYVRVRRIGERNVILRATDQSKDQSYMLWSLTPEQISHFKAPLGEYTKPEVRELALELGLSVAKKSDSQDICFIPDGDYRAFLGRVAELPDREGDFRLSDGRVIGRHLGQSFYTLGQRKGLGIAHTEPLYVVGRDIGRNEIILGSDGELFKTRFEVRDASFSALDFPGGDFRCEVRIRYRAPLVSARLIPIGEGRLSVETDVPVRAVTPGQSAVFYDGETLLGGGIIV